MNEVFDEKVPYDKRPLSIQTQIERLKGRGLIIDDEKLAVDYLSNISYYRLRAYTYPFQDNTNLENDHKFIRSDIHFKDIIDLYCFDRRLRSLIFNAIEKIEVALRARITQRYCESCDDSHWYEDESLFKDTTYLDINGEEEFCYDKLLDDIMEKPRLQELFPEGRTFIVNVCKREPKASFPIWWVQPDMTGLDKIEETLRGDN